MWKIMKKFDTRLPGFYRFANNDDVILEENDWCAINWLISVIFISHVQEGKTRENGSGNFSTYSGNAIKYKA